MRGAESLDSLLVKFSFPDFRRNKILKVLTKASALALPDNEDCQTNISSAPTEPVQ